MYTQQHAFALRVECCGTLPHLCWCGGSAATRASSRRLGGQAKSIDKNRCVRTRQMYDVEAKIIILAIRQQTAVVCLMTVVLDSRPQISVHWRHAALLGPKRHCPYLNVRDEVMGKYVTAATSSWCDSPALAEHLSRVEPVAVGRGRRRPARKQRSAHIELKIEVEVQAESQSNFSWKQIEL
jgi:hypothetical protein